MKNKTLTALVLASAVALGGPALAQEQTASVSAQTGQVTVSSRGSDFQTLAQGQTVRVGDRVMLLEGSSVTLNFSNGCALNLNKPGVYTVPAVSGSSGCGAFNAQGVDWTGAAIIAGGVAVVAAGLASMDEVPGPPESR